MLLPLGNIKLHFTKKNMVKVTIKTFFQGIVFKD